ncbi:hypothetical protein [Limosilactobacillus fermentum]|uniref:hypothetical protein n=1 Tax=Limosilactobacillus fermentum TaxID=1613 RepID=UPI000D2FE885|nr:hypothetical protein [Limosilactobacillus fermentum]PTV36357.1 hypothetical protein DB329_04540 [Limosilactobacillus fermentum]QAR23228.1 hypothetical protein EQG56_01480 [Limosilactobacillus fermentum]
MKSINVKQAERLVKALAKAGPVTKVTLLTRKKDRQLTIERGTAAVVIDERGFYTGQISLNLSDGQAKHALLQAFKREFPRSHHLYLHQEKD